MRPSGLGLREKSRHDHEPPPNMEVVGVLADVGERWPFDAGLPFVAVSSCGFPPELGLLVVFLLAGVIRVILRASIGLRLRVRERRRSSGGSESSSSRSSSTGFGVPRRFLAADLVTGPPYEVCAVSRSDGVGLGEMTRGVAGMACFPGIDIAQEKGGKAGGVMTPLNRRVRRCNGMGQRAEWRCLSFLDWRGVVVPGDAHSAVLCWRLEKAATVATESSLKSGDAVELGHSTAWLAS